VITKDIYII